MGKVMKVLLVLLMMVTMLPIQNVSAKTNQARVNLAFNQTATASDVEAEQFGAVKAFDGIVDYTNSAQQSRWASHASLPTADNPKWLKVDLGSVQTIHEFQIDWERKNATHYSLQISNDDSSWQSVFTSTQQPDDYTQKIILDQAVEARYVKLVIQSFLADCLVRNTDGSEKNMDWDTVSVFEFGVYKVVDVTDDNLALENQVVATANGREGDLLTPDKAIDGDDSTRWASDVGQGTKWFQVDLQTLKVVSSVNIHWERKNATSFDIMSSRDGTNWTTLYSAREEPDDYIQSINLTHSVETRFIKIVIHSFHSVGAPENGNSVDWGTVSMYEFEVYSTFLDIVNVNTVANGLTAPEVTQDTTELPLPLVPAGYQISIEGTDYDELANQKGRIFQPLVNSQVKVNLKVTDGRRIANKELVYTIPGEVEIPKTDNKPMVIPEIREWSGQNGDFKVTSESRIVIHSDHFDELKRIAVEFQNDYQDIMKRKLTIVKAVQPAPGDFYFTLGSDDQGLHKEGYRLSIDESVQIEALDKQGAYWATRTILQILKQTNGTIAKGQMRDYPKYDVRGFMLDVGRKPFSLEYLQATVKNMAWYKLNDFQVHLNDNYIWIEEYVNDGIDPRDPQNGAYSGFRLESSIVGDNGVALTSTDQSYSKKDFQSFILDARELGIDVVPEIDTPAHSLALTKVRPDLALDTTHPHINRAQDHLNLSATKYDQSLVFVKDIFDEYLTGEQPVFDSSTIVNIGTDEYDGALSNEFRKFTDDMLEYIQESGRQVRLWGSLSARPGSQSVRSENVQMNIWNTGWANPVNMLKQGYQIINMQDSNLYMVPNGKGNIGGYNDYLNNAHLYNNWTPHQFGGTVISSTDKNVLGAAYAIWNDNIDRRLVDLSQEDIFTRFFASLPTMSEKTWGEGRDKTFDELTALTQKTGYAPCSKVYGNPVIEATDIQLNTQDRQMEVNDTFDVVATLVPANPSYTQLSYHSSDSSVVMIDDQGHITALKAGKATITIEDQMNDLRTQFDVIVKNKDVQLTENQTNIQLESDTGVIPENAVLNVEHIHSGEQYAQAKNLLQSVGDKVTLYDIRLLFNDQEIQPSGKVKLKIPVPEHYNHQLIELYYINGDKKEKLDFKIEDGFIVFEVDHFSLYAIVEKEKSPEPNQDPSQEDPSPEYQDPSDQQPDHSQTESSPTVDTGDSMNMNVFAILFILSVGCIWIFRKKQDKNMN